jgi:hypothetical protein
MLTQPTCACGGEVKLCCHFLLSRMDLIHRRQETYTMRCRAAWLAVITASVTLLVVVGSTVGELIVGSLSSGDVVGVRFEVCQRCRVKDLPEVSRFINELLPQYPAIELRDVVGAEPVMIYLDAFQSPVASVLVAELSSDGIVEDLSEHGIFMWTPRPEYAPTPIVPMERCVAWRQTGGCDGGKGVREPHLDERCDVRITFDRSGFCECSPSRRVALDCDHDEGNCLQYCGVDTE